MRLRNVLPLLPLAVGLVHEGVRAIINRPETGTVTTTAKAKKGESAAKEFSVPLETLRDWAKAVVVSVGEVKIEGNSAVHPLEDDCELHFGAHTPEFKGDPDGLVLEPMNACVEDPPDPFASWSAFAKSISFKLTRQTVTASGVPRLWPEHLIGGTDSNPDHAAELHPLTTIIAGAKTFDFSRQVFAGEYRGKDGNRGISKRVTLSVTTVDGTVNVSFRGGQIGNFTTLELEIDRASIASDGAGSFRMNGDAVMDDSTTVPVRIVTAKGSPINDTMPGMKSAAGPATIHIEDALVLHSLNTEALLDAALRSHGRRVNVTDRPVQLILYGPADSE